MLAEPIFSVALLSLHTASVACRNRTTRLPQMYFPHNHIVQTHEPTFSHPQLTFYHWVHHTPGWQVVVVTCSPTPWVIQAYSSMSSFGLPYQTQPKELQHLFNGLSKTSELEKEILRAETHVLLLAFPSSMCFFFQTPSRIWKFLCCATCTTLPGNMFVEEQKRGQRSTVDYL